MNPHISPYHVSAGPTPRRGMGSIRRTSTIDADWPQGWSGNIHFIARARDAITPVSGGAPVVLAEDSYEAELARDRTILSIHAEPMRPELARLVGLRGGGKLRAALSEILPAERRAATPLYLILDDISGASLVSPWALGHWSSEWQEHRAALVQTHNVTDVCVGFKAGSPSIGLLRREDNLGSPAPDLRNPDDPEGWHVFPPHDNAGFRRARWIDVTQNDLIHIESGFQDSATTPDGGRRAVHEYRLTAAVDPHTMRLVTLTPHPHILPYSTCGAAVESGARLIGMSMSELREAVPEQLRGPLGCTHLNDVFRALAEVPALAASLREFLNHHNQVEAS